MKAQGSFEYMVIISLLLTVFLVMMAVSFSSNINLFQLQDSKAALRNSYAVASAINFVYLAGDGASYDLTLTDVMNEENITIYDYSVTSERPYASASAPLLNAKTNTSSPGKGKVKITNDHGEILVGK